MTKFQRSIKGRAFRNISPARVDAVVCHEDGTVSLKHGYFYRNGNTPQKWGDVVSAAFPNAKLIEAFDDWNEWPKTSYFVARIGER